MTIQADADLILHELAKYPDYIGAETLSEAVGLSVTEAARVNNAVSILEANGYVKALRVHGGPFDFAKVTITPQGRY